MQASGGDMLSEMLELLGDAKISDKGDKSESKGSESDKKAEKK